MASVKASLWSVTNNPLPLQSVRISGHIEDFKSYFTIVHTYYNKQPRDDLFFQFYLFDLGLVSGYKVLVNGNPVSANVVSTSALDKEDKDLIKAHTNPSASESLFCHCNNVQADTPIEVHISFVQSLRLEDDHTFSIRLPTTLSPKTYYSPSDSQQLSTALRQFSFSLDVSVRSSFGSLSVNSPLHPISFSEDRITLLPSPELLPDSDVVLLLKYDQPITNKLNRCYFEKNGGENVVLVSACPHLVIPKIDVDEDDEEGHPEAREILFVLDTNHIDFEEVQQTLSAVLENLTLQILFNVIILDKELKKLFHKSQPAGRREIEKAREYITGEEFRKAWDEAQASPIKFLDGLKQVYKLDVVSEDLPRKLVVLSKCLFSNQAPLLSHVEEHSQDFAIFPIVLGSSANFYALNTLSRLTEGYAECIYATEKEQKLLELSAKVRRQIERITQPEFDELSVEWGNGWVMQLQSPEEQKFRSFFSGDQLLVCGVVSKLPQVKTDLMIKFRSKFITTTRVVIPFDPEHDLVSGNDKPLSLFQLKIEREQPTESAVNWNKFISPALVLSGAIGKGVAFTASEQVHNCAVHLLSVSGSGAEPKESTGLLRIGKDALLALQGITLPPLPINLGDLEKGAKPLVSNRILANMKAKKPQRQSKIAVNTQWDAVKQDDFFRHLNSMLNKMSVPNFESLKEKLLAMKSMIEADVETLDQFVQLVFEKPLVGPNFAALYADLCVALSLSLKKQFPSPDPQRAPFDFRTLLLKHCKGNFDSCFAEVPAEDLIKDGDELEVQVDKMEKEHRRKERIARNIGFIAELYIRRLVKPLVVHDVLDKLLLKSATGQFGRPDNQKIELCCKFITTLGPRLESPQHLTNTNAYFTHLQALSTEKDVYDFRTRFMITDLIDLRKSRWTKVGRGGLAPAPEPTNYAAAERMLKTRFTSRNLSNPLSLPHRERTEAAGRTPTSPPQQRGRGRDRGERKDHDERPNSGGRGGRDRGGGGGPGGGGWEKKSDRGGRFEDRGGRSGDRGGRFDDRSGGSSGGAARFAPPKGGAAGSGTRPTHTTSDEEGFSTRGGRGAGRRGGGVGRGSAGGGAGGEGGTVHNAFQILQKEEQQPAEGGRDKRPKFSAASLAPVAKATQLAASPKLDHIANVSTSASPPDSPPPNSGGGGGAWRPRSRDPQQPSSPPPELKSKAKGEQGREEANQKLKSSLRDYKEEQSVEEFIDDYESLNYENKGVECVSVIICASLDCKDPERRLYKQLYSALGTHLSPANVQQGISESLPILQDILLDVPLAYNYFGDYLYLSITPMGLLKVEDLYTTLQPLIEQDEEITLKLLNVVFGKIIEETGEEEAKQLISKIDLQAFTQKTQSWPAILKDKAPKLFSLL